VQKPKPRIDLLARRSRLNMMKQMVKAEKYVILSSSFASPATSILIDEVEVPIIFVDSLLVKKKLSELFDNLVKTKDVKLHTFEVPIINMYKNLEVYESSSDVSSFCCLEKDGISSCDNKKSFQFEDIVESRFENVLKSLSCFDLKEENRVWKSEIHPFSLDCFLLGGSKNLLMEKPLRDDSDYLDMSDIRIDAWRYIKNIDKEIYDGLIFPLKLSFVASFKDYGNGYFSFFPDTCLFKDDMYYDLSQFFETYMSIGMEVDVAVINNGDCPVDFSVVMGYARLIDCNVEEIYEALSNHGVQHVAKMEKGQNVVLCLEKNKEFLDYTFLDDIGDYDKKTRVGHLSQYKRPVLMMHCKFLGEEHLKVDVNFVVKGFYQICLMNPTSYQMMSGRDLKNSMKVVDCYDGFEPRIGFEILRYPKIANFYMEEDIKKNLYYRGSYGSYLKVVEKEQKEKVRKSKRKKRRKIKRSFGKKFEQFTDDELVCVVCLDIKRNICFRPCSHIVVCDHCSVDLEKCPICRCSIQEKFTVIFS